MGTREPGRVKINVYTPHGWVGNYSLIPLPGRIPDEFFELSFHVIYSPWVQISFLEQVTIERRSMWLTACITVTS